MEEEDPHPGEVTVRVEDMARQEEVCVDHHHRAGMEVDVDEVLRPQDITMVLMLKAWLPANLHHTTNEARLRQIMRNNRTINEVRLRQTTCQLDERLRWTHALEPLPTMANSSMAVCVIVTAMFRACLLCSKEEDFLPRRRSGRNQDQAAYSALHQNMYVNTGYKRMSLGKHEASWWMMRNWIGERVYLVDVWIVLSNNSSEGRIPQWQAAP